MKINYPLYNIKCWILIMAKLIKFYIIVFLFTINAQVSMAQSNNNNIKIISSPDKVVASSAQNGANAIRIINSPGLNFASTLNIGWISVALGLAVASVWDGSKSEQSSSSGTTN